MTLLVEAISGTFGAYLIFIFASGFFSKYRRSTWKRQNLYFLLGLFMVVVNCLPMMGFVRSGLILFLLIPFFTFIYDTKVRQAVLVAFCFVTLCIVAETLCEFPFYLMGVARAAIISGGLARCIYIVLANLVNYLLIISLVTIFGRKGVLKVSLREYAPLVICQIISIFVCIVFLELVAVASKFLLILMAVSVVGVLFINVVFFVYMRYIQANYENEQRKLLAEQQLKIQIAYYQQMKEAQEQTRSMWHDIKKQLSAVTALVEKKEAKTAATYLDELEESFDKITRVVDVEHPVISAVLNDAVQKAKASGIDIRVDVFVSPDLRISPLDLSVILGNTLENAVLACASVSDPLVQKCIRVKLKQKADLLFYQITNPYDIMYPNRKREGVHGYGLKNVTDCVERNNGTIHIKNGNGLFCVEIIISQE